MAHWYLLFYTALATISTCVSVSTSDHSTPIAIWSSVVALLLVVLALVAAINGVF